MKASLNWLRSLVPGLDAPWSEIAERLTRGGLEVEAVSHFGQGLEKVLVVAVLEVAAHPSRSNLHLVTVDCGGGDHRTVVCGAPNVPAPGGLVCLAPLGTRLPAVNLTIAPRSIGGVTSNGMLCSEVELGVGEDGSGLWILAPGTAAPGTPLPQAIPAVQDTIFEIGVTPNRPDALGHIGIARDLAALFKLDFHAPQAQAPVRIGTGSINEHIQIQVEDYDRCPHYGALVVDDVHIGPSPLWLKLRLSSLGVRPISNIVDITNLILLEYGHPMHAFDLDLIRGKKVIVRRAQDGEKMTTLDGQKHTLDADDLLICDAEGPIALAGVMGGENTEIRPTTRRVLFECAYFNPRGVRRTSRRHGIHTESSHRFERGVDRNDAQDVLAQAGALATRLADAKAVPGAIHAYEEAWTPKPLQLRQTALDRLLGIHVPLEQAKDILKRLGFEPTDSHDGDKRALVAAIPSHRPDVSREVDLIEEVARIQGLDAIPTELPPILPQAPRSAMVLEGLTRRAAVELGLSEALTYGFVSPKSLEQLGAPEPSVKVLNPLTEERSVMRTTLAVGLLETASRARRHGERNAKLFTIGSVFLPALPGSKLPDEQPMFAALLTGSREAYLTRAEDIDVFDAKGYALAMIERVIRRRDVQLEPYADGQAPAHLHPRAAARLVCAGHELGSFGMLHPQVAETFDVATSTALIELSLRALEKLGRATPSYQPIPRLPASSRDIALVVPETTTAGEVEAVIRQAAGELCESVELFDVYRGKNIPAEHVSLAYHVVYRDPKAATDPDHARTLTDEEVDQRHRTVVQTAQQKLSAALR